MATPSNVATPDHYPGGYPLPDCPDCESLPCECQNDGGKTGGKHTPVISEKEVAAITDDLGPYGGGKTSRIQIERMIRSHDALRQQVTDLADAMDRIVAYIKSGGRRCAEISDIATGALIKAGRIS